MNADLAEAVDIVTGALVARSVEPSAGEGRYQSGTCLNCGTDLLGAHCHVCGQKAAVHRTIGAFGHDILHSVLHFDGKLWRTLPLLFWNPGELTRRYIHGERAKFVSPLALFLFTVFLTFAVVNQLVPDDTSVNGAGHGSIQTTINGPDFALERQQLQAKIARLENEIVEARKKSKPTDVLEEELRSNEEELRSNKLGLKLMGTATSTFGNANGSNNNPGLSDGDFPGAAALKKAADTATKNPQLLLYKIQSNAYKYSWALIPISVPFLWLLFFWRPQYKMFDHAVFVTYSLTFIMQLGVMCALLISVPETEIIGGLLLTLYPPIHMYRQLRRAYQTSRFGAFWRMCLLSVFAITALTLFAVLVVTLGVA
jgi:hypothetical protein